MYVNGKGGCCCVNRVKDGCVRDGVVTKKMFLNVGGEDWSCHEKVFHDFL